MCFQCVCVYRRRKKALTSKSDWRTRILKRCQSNGWVKFVCLCHVEHAWQCLFCWQISLLFINVTNLKLLFYYVRLQWLCSCICNAEPEKRGGKMRMYRCLLVHCVRAHHFDGHGVCTEPLYCRNKITYRWDFPSFSLLFPSYSSTFRKWDASSVNGYGNYIWWRNGCSSPMLLNQWCKTFCILNYF